jgi:hypothetical protein
MLRFFSDDLMGVILQLVNVADLRNMYMSSPIFQHTVIDECIRRYKQILIDNFAYFAIQRRRLILRHKQSQVRKLYMWIVPLISYMEGRTSLHALSKHAIEVHEKVRELHHKLHQTVTRTYEDIFGTELNDFEMRTLYEFVKNALNEFTNAEKVASATTRTFEATRRRLQKLLFIIDSSAESKTTGKRARED